MKVLVAVVLVGMVACQGRYKMDNRWDRAEMSNYQYRASPEEYRDERREYGGDENGVENWMQEAIKEMTDSLDLEEILDNSTRSGLSQEMDFALTGLRPEMCFDTESECTSSMFLGCNCINGFKAQEQRECREVPCDMYTYIYKNIADILREMKRMRTAEDMAELFTKRVYKPLMGLLCDCREAFSSSTVNCIQNYDGGMLDMMGSGAASGYQATMEKIDFERLENVIFKALGVHCVTDQGEYCFPEFADNFVEMMEMADESFERDAGEDYCGNFKRVRDQFYGYMDTYKQDWSAAVMEYNPNQMGYMLQKVIDAYYTMQTDFWCEEDCSRKYAKNFFSTCCAYNAAQAAGDKELWGDAYAVAKNLFGIVAEGKKFPKVDKCVLKKMIKAQNPVKMCNINNSYKDYRKATRKCKKMEM